MRGLAASPVPDGRVLVGGVVVHHQVQLHAGVGAGDLAQEDEELLVAVPGLAAGGDLARQRREHGRGPVAHVVRGAAFDQVGLGR